MSTIDDRADALVSRARELQLDTLYRRVEALGGYFEPTNDRSKGYAEALKDVLVLISEMGGQHPDVRAYEKERAA